MARHSAAPGDGAAASDPAAGPVNARHITPAPVGRQRAAGPVNMRHTMPGQPPGREHAAGHADVAGPDVAGLAETAHVDGATDIEPSDPEPIELDQGRISPVLIGILALAVIVFVAGAAWAVTRPSHSTPAPPAAVSSVGVLPQGAAGTSTAGAGDAVPGSPSPHVTSPAPGPTSATAGAPAAPPPTTGRPTASPAQGAATVTATFTLSTWQPNGMLVAATVTAGATALTGWRATFRCTGPDGSWQLQVGSSIWGATKVSSDVTSITVHSMSWNGSVAPGHSASFGFVASWGPASQPAGATPTCSMSAIAG